MNVAKKLPLLMQQPITPEGFYITERTLVKTTLECTVYYQTSHRYL